MTFNKKIIALIAVLNGIAWSWLFLIDDARLSDNDFVAYLVITIVYLFIVSIATAVYWLTTKYILANIKTSKNWLVILKVFFVWSFAEFFVSWLVAVIWMGRNGSWGTILPFSSLTPGLMWTSFGFLSRLVGFYGLSSAFVTTIFVCLHPKLRKYVPAYLSVLLGLIFIAWAAYQKPNGSDIKATITSQYIGKADYKIDPKDSQLAVLPEYGLDNFDNKNIGQLFETNKQIDFVGSKQFTGSNGYTNVLIFGNNKLGFLKQEQKSRLIPGGEYLSLPVEAMLKSFSNDTYVNFQVTRAVVKGHDKLEPYQFNPNLNVGAAVCSSIIASEDYRTLVSQGANLLTNSSSLEIFRGSRMFNFQHRGLAKFMAVANARSFLQSSNNWAAFAIDQNGRQLAEVNPIGTTNVVVKTNSQKTVYSLLGEWTAIIGGLWLLFEIIGNFWRKKSKKLSTSNLKKT